MLTKSVLDNLCPRPKKDKAKQAIWDGYVGALLSPEGQSLLATYGIISETRLAHLLAQWAHECAGFTIVWESGAYSATRIIQIFGVGHHTARVTPSEAKALAYNGPALFERVYGLGNPKKAKELGNTEPGDGWRYRGCGIVQLTGGDAHRRYSKSIGCPIEDLAKPLPAVHGALLEWKEKGCNALADREDGSDAAVRAITRKINGGLNGFAERRLYLKKALKLLDGAGPAPVAVAAPTDRPQAVELGDGGVNVRELQDLLKRAGYDIAVDGEMGKKTEAALAGFQVNHGIAGTGKADSITWKLLREVTDPEKSKPAPPPPAVTVATVRQESRAFRYLGRVRFGLKALYTTAFGGVAAEASGIDVIDTVTSQADRVQSIGTKMTPFLSGHGRFILILIALGVLVWVLDMVFGKSEAEYVEKVQNA
jgi:putative chitinase